MERDRDLERALGGRETGDFGKTFGAGAALAISTIGAEFGGPALLVRGKSRVDERFTAAEWERRLPGAQTLMRGWAASTAWSRATK